MTSSSQESFNALTTFSGHTSGITSIVILLDSRIASASYDHTIKLWDPATGVCEKTLTEHEECVWALIVLSNGMLASGAGDKLIKLWHPTTGICVNTFFETAQILALAQISEDKIISACWDKSIKIWDYVTQKCVKRLEGHGGSVWVFTPISKDFIASGSNDSSIKVWNIKNEDDHTLLGHTGFIRALVRLAEHKLASGSQDKLIKTWNLKTNLCEQTLIGHQGAINALVLFDHQTLISGSADKTFKIWNLLTSLCNYTIIGHDDCVTSLQFLSEKYLISGSIDKVIKVWDTSSILNFSVGSANTTHKHIESIHSLPLQNEVTMKEYLEIAEIYIKNGRPADYHAFLEHPDLLELKTQLGIELMTAFLCLLHLRCRVNDSFLQRLMRYKQEKRLRDIETAILKLAELGFELNVALLDDMCAKAGKDKTFLLSVRLMDVMKKAGFFDTKSGTLSEKVFRLTKTEKLELYEKLFERNALDIHIIENSSVSDMPSDKRKLEASIDVYYYASICECTSQLNYPSEQKLYVISAASSFDGQDIIIILKKLHEKQLLNKKTFFLIFRVKTCRSYLLKVIDILDKSSINIDFFSNLILDRKKDYPKIHVLFQLLNLVQQEHLMDINEEYLTSLVLMTDYLDQILESLDYLDRRTALTKDTYLLVMFSYEEKTRKPTIKSSTKKLSTLSSGLFSSRMTTDTSDIEVGSVVYALLENNLLELPLDCMSRLFSTNGSAFVLDLFQLNELSQRAIELANQLDFNKKALDAIAAIARLHQGLPPRLPEILAEEYLECWALLAPFSQALPDEILEFSFAKPELMNRLLMLLIDEKIMTVEAVIEFHRNIQDVVNIDDFLKEVFYCIQLNLSVAYLDTFIHCKSKSEILFKAFQSLKQSGVDFLPESGHGYLLTELQQSEDPLLDVEIIQKLFLEKLLNHEIILLIRTKESSKKRFIVFAIARLIQCGQCNYDALFLILSNKNHALALHIFLLLAEERVPISLYWGIIMRHPYPLVLSQGLIELKHHGILTTEFFDKITQSKQPLLAAKALLFLLQSGVSFESLWKEVADSENPEEYSQIIVASLMPEQLDITWPHEIKQAITQHSHPQIARQYISLLMPIHSVKKSHILEILESEEASDIIQALLELEKLTTLNDMIINVIIHDNEMLNPLKQYFALNTPSETLFERICASSSSKKAENLIKREEIMRKITAEHPSIDALLHVIFDRSEIHENRWIEALALLDSVNEMNQNSIELLQKSTEPEKRAVAIVALKKAGLYTEVYMNRAIKRENQSGGIYNTLRYLSEENQLSNKMFDFVMINSKYNVIKAAKVLLRMPGVQQAHVNWLSESDEESCKSDLIFALKRFNCLTAIWVEKIMQQKEERLQSILIYTLGCPAAFQNESMLEKIITLAPDCYDYDENDEKYLYSPFSLFEKEPFLLTKDVFDLLLISSSKEACEIIYENMVALQKLNLFQPDNIKCCTTNDRTQSIIELSKEGLWDEKNKAIVLASLNPLSDSALIICLEKQNKFNSLTADLLLSRLRLIRSNTHVKDFSGANYRYYFSIILKKLVENFSLNQRAIQHLLGMEIKWKTLEIILNNISDKTISETQICILTTIDSNYLEAYVNYMLECYPKNIKIADILRLYEYEDFLNQPDLMKVIKNTISKEAKKEGLKIEVMQQLLNDVWLLCSSGNREAVIERITMFNTTASTIRPRR